MSRASVRAAVTAYLAPPNVYGLNRVLRSFPRDQGGIEYTSGAPGEASGAVGIVYIEHQRDEIRGMDGAGGGRLTTYVVAFQVLHRSIEPDMQDAMDHFDKVIDAASTRLRSDPKLGLTQAAANTAGLINGAYEGLEVEFGEPVDEDPDTGQTSTWAVIRFPVLEWNQVT